MNDDPESDGTVTSSTFNSGTADPSTCEHEALMTVGSVTSCMLCHKTMERCPACKCERCGGSGYVPA